MSKDCRHKCDHPGWMRFYVDGKPVVFWSGIITIRKIHSAEREYLGTLDALPDDVTMPLRQMRLEEAI